MAADVAGGMVAEGLRQLSRGNVPEFNDVLLPTHVDDEILKAMAVPMIGHRDSLYSDLHGEVVTKLKKFLGTEDHVYLSASSSTGMMEGSIRNVVNKKKY